MSRPRARWAIRAGASRCSTSCRTSCRRCWRRRRSRSRLRSSPKPRCRSWASDSSRPRRPGAACSMPRNASSPPRRGWRSGRDFRFSWWCCRSTWSATACATRWIQGNGRRVSSNNTVGVYCLFTGCDDLSTCRSTAVPVRTIQMRALPFQLLLILATILGLADVSDAASVEPNRAPDAKRADPCSTSGARIASPSPAPWRARISRRDAVYVILHVQKACRYLAESPDSRSASSTPQLASIFDDLHTAVLDPIYRSHPDLESAVLPVSATQKVPRATPRDVQRTTATRMSDDLTRLQRQIYKLSTQNLDQLPDKSAAEKALQPFNDAAAE